MRHFKVVFQPYGRRIEVEEGETILEAAAEGSIGLRSECGGRGLCGRCRVLVDDPQAVSPPTAAEAKLLGASELEGAVRLACQTRVRGDVVVNIPPESRVEAQRIEVRGLSRAVKLEPRVWKSLLRLERPALGERRGDLERVLEAVGGEAEVEWAVLRTLPEALRSGRWEATATLWGDTLIALEPGDTTNTLYGLAVDIGTSKIVVQVVDLKTGEVASTGAMENPQAIHGEDIMARMTYAMESPDNLEELQRLAAEGVNRALEEALSRVEVEEAMIYEAAVACNTAMHHLFLGLDPRYLAVSPFTPVVGGGFCARAQDLGLDINPGARVYLPPVVAGFVGPDAIADVIATGLHEAGELSLLIDVGTNTEVILGNREELWASSCASGPAFEGAHIKDGMRAVEGAIERIWIDEGHGVRYQTIGGVKPLGLCGSAVVDAVAEMLRSGLLTPRGRIAAEGPRVRPGPPAEFVIAWGGETATGRDITLTERDINEIQLAKAAIYTASKILMERMGVKPEVVERLYIAGAFGSYLNPENAKEIGMIPDVPSDRIRLVGNTAVEGARLMLISTGLRGEAERIAEEIKYVELSNDPAFLKEYPKALYLGRFD
ncbi:MAG: ferredoxin [Candidatus Bathyarchaeota archaeon B23]|nr:MAG: ferredoxin [Candidatus Bathyarchaeota archaeon B23]